MIPHHLLDIRIHKIHTLLQIFKQMPDRVGRFINGKIPHLEGEPVYSSCCLGLLCGGINPELRNKLRKLAEMEGPEYLHRQLKAVDSESRVLHPNDLRCVIRAGDTRKIAAYFRTSKKPTQPFMMQRSLY